ncbi:carboxypeptidase Q-like [Haliotis rufescens]|uniref:carboxypeptidase Q-like n=1 Tax=Haliotis rufescens TaxID=6454 RepID=UPI00201EED30|nr:carboxypeptidase Q-like [Haliotis rufescens]
MEFTLLVLTAALMQAASIPLTFHSVKDEIESHRADAERIINLVVNGSAKGQTYNRLAEFVDTFGSRIAGSQNLENAIDYMMKKLKEDGLENVHGESAMVPHWVRGRESATLEQPRILPLNILGLGGSIATPPEGITAEVIVVKTFAELKQRAAEARGKIVVYNEDWVGYGDTVQYRSLGAVEAAKVGAVASLIRSVTPFSIDSPHTGWQDYSDNVTKIPTACITIEIAQMLHRMSMRGEKMVITLKMEAQNLPMVKSRNTVAEIKGSTYPDEVVIVSGHLDSWDVGQGAMDDGGGAFISWQALSLIRQLGLRPKRTLRMIMWTGEEEGLWGAQEYFKQHQAEIPKHSLVMESDMGTFNPRGLQFSGNKAATAIMKEVAQLLSSINRTTLYSPADVSDTTLWENIGVPSGSIENDNQNYFYFHHSNGDMMTVENSGVLDLCSAIWAVAAYVVADLDAVLPRDTAQGRLQL